MAFNPIAICGYSCKLPGDAVDAESFWQMCVQGRDAWSSIPETRFSREAFHNASQGEPGTTTVIGGHFLKEDVYAFDASFFNMSIETAESMDPAIRLQLESVYEALEHAGMTLDRVASSKTSVYSGAFHRDYHDSLSRNPDELPRFLLTGTGTAMLSNRISHFFDLRGPSMTIDTGCSSSLTSLHSACRSLQAGDCDMAIVTGSNVLLNPDAFISMSGLGLLGPTGRSYAFEKRAEGYGRGEGVVTLVLKRLDGINTDEDTIHAIIRGSATNQDGKTSTITSPSQSAQESVISDCYASAKLDPRQTAFVECHGTGTQVGDYCEAAAIYQAFDTETRHYPLYLGSAKSNVGHLEAGSGLVSIVKVIKALQYDTIPPNYDFVNPNPTIPWEDWNLAVPSKPLPWPSGFARRASINSFGFGGSNSHVIIEAPNQMEETHVNGHAQVNGHVQVNGHAHVNGHVHSNPRGSSDGYLFLLSANDALSCTSAKSRLRAYLEKLGGTKDGSEGCDKSKILSSLAYKLAHKRTHFKWRTATKASSISELVEALSSTEPKPVLSTTTPSLGFVFTGQGAHWPGMGRELIDSYPVFEEALRQLDQCMVNLGASWSIIDELRRDSSESRLDDAQYSMPVCCALQIALVILLRSWNIFPSAVSGHSSGESAAAFAAGALDMQSALAVQYFRGVLTASSKSASGINGAMLAVGLDPEAAAERIKNITAGKVVIGCYNSPCSVTLSGDEAGIIEAEKQMTAEGVFARKLKVQTAFHSHHMMRDAAEYRQLLESSFSETVGEMKVPLASSVTGTWITEAKQFGPEHWVNYMLEPVRFTEASTKILTETANKPPQRSDQRPVDIILEIGPHSALSSPLKQTMKTLKLADVAYSSVLKRQESALASTQSMMGFLWSHGYLVDLKAISPGGHRGRAHDFDLPSYTWNHTKSLAVTSPSETAFRRRRHPKHLLIGSVQPTSDPSAPSWQRTSSINKEAWPEQLYLGDLTLSTIPTLLSMPIAAMQQLASYTVKPADGYLISLKNVRLNLRLTLSDTPTRVLLRTSLHDTRVSRDIASDLTRTFKIHCVQDANEWTLLSTGQISLQRDTILGETTTDAPFTHSDACAIPIRVGSLPNIKARPDLGMPPPSTAHLSFSPNTFTVSMLGLCAYENESMNTQALDVYRKLASVFQAFSISRYALFSDEGMNEQVSIGQLAMYNGQTSYLSSPYSVEVETRRGDGTSSVVWNTISDSQTSIRPAANDIHLQNIIVTPRIGSIGALHASSLCHSLINVSNEAMEDIPRHHLSANEKSTLLDLNTLCRGFFYQTLKTLRADPPRRLLGHFASYVQFMKSIESTSAAEWEALSEEEIVSLRNRVISSSVNGQLVCRVGDQLIPLIRGQVDPLEVMMKDRLLYRYYEEGLRWTRSYEQLRSLIRLLSVEHPRMDILEIGAGTGGATTSVLEALATGEQSAEGIRCESYTYTDISAGFFSKAKEKFEKYTDVMVFKKLNIEQDLQGQSFEHQTYDLIVASQCLHATSNMRKTMTNVRKLLKLGGRLVMVETTNDSLDIQLFASCFRGWWLSEEVERKWSPSLSESLWRQVLRDSGFSGIDFTVRDCEDEDLYAMQVILSTASYEPDPPNERREELYVVTSDTDPGTTIATTVSDEMTSFVSVTAVTPSQLGQANEDALYIAVDTEESSRSDREKIVSKLGSSKGALLATTRRGEDLDSLRSMLPSPPVVSVAVDPELDIYGRNTATALSSILKAPPERRDKSYVLQPHQLQMYRAAPFTSLSLDTGGKSVSGPAASLKAHCQYVVRGRSVALISACCAMIASLGGGNICAHLHDKIENYESELAKLQLYATQISKTKGCRVVIAATGAKVDLDGQVAGIIDFGDVEENVDLGLLSRQPELPPSMTGDLDFHIRLASLHSILLPGWAPSSCMGITTMYTGAIATNDTLTQKMRLRGSETLEMSTTLVVLANLVLQTKERLSGQTLYVGLPTSLSAEERDRLVADLHFRHFSPRRKLAGDRRSGSEATFQVVPGMSEEARSGAIRGAIVNYIAAMFMLSRSEVDESGPLSQYIDSLTSTQLRAWLLATFRAALTAQDLADSTSIRQLADLVSSRWTE
ncbi:hypothetical protein HD806DRAFT_535136 [Xylariaceae sp. AK1471]|nr:hypothetical protein HD806DRAFT_535136 [Xylariaceae sp. AK1471]